MLLIELLIDFSLPATFCIGLHVHISLWLAIPCFLFFLFRFSKGWLLKKRTQGAEFVTSNSFNNTNGIQYLDLKFLFCHDQCALSFLPQQIILHSDTATFEIWWVSELWCLAHLFQIFPSNSFWSEILYCDCFFYQRYKILQMTSLTKFMDSNTLKRKLKVRFGKILFNV